MVATKIFLADKDAVSNQLHENKWHGLCSDSNDYTRDKDWVEGGEKKICVVGPFFTF